MNKFLFLAACLLCACAGEAPAVVEAASLKQDGFVDETILDWHVKVSAEFQRDHPLLVQQAIALLRRELTAIVEATFWLDERVPEGTPSAKVPVAHHSRDWLRQHGLNPDMAGGIEIPNAQTFLDSYSWEPWAMMHELAHFYHHTALGERNGRILGAYRHARETHLYESVPHYDGRMLPAYAAKNEREYFAELTEAYFGRNDFYPFTRDELRFYDPVGFAMIRDVWEAP